MTPWLTQLRGDRLHFDEYVHVRIGQRVTSGKGTEPTQIEDEHRACQSPWELTHHALVSV